jgi:ATP/maltotriose-dependent transcriptional regulator MalT
VVGAGLALLNAALVLADQGRFRAAQDAFDEAEALGLHGTLDVRRFLYRSRLALLLGRLEQAEELLRRHDEFAVEAMHVVWANELLAEVRLAQGRADEAMVLARRCRLDARKLAARLAVIPTSLVARAHLALGELEAARIAVDQCRELAAASQVPFDHLVALLAVGEVHLALGDIATVRSAVSWAAPAVASLDLTHEAPLRKRWAVLRDAVVTGRIPD